MKGVDIRKAVKNATNQWAKMRKAEYKGNRRPRMHVYSNRVYFTDVVDEILPEAYKHASGNGQYSVSKRQFYYASRKQFYQRTGRQIEYQHLANTLLVQFINRNPNATAHWKITADPRGTLSIPNATSEVRVPVGTIPIENHLRQVKGRIDPFGFDPKLDIEWPSIAPKQRYQGVLYIEKEGFEPILKEAQIAQRYDLAIISCKGQSVVAARRYVDEVCKVNGGVPLFVAHDFDKAGFEIAERLTSVSDWAYEHDRVAYEFQNEINVYDIGLRLEDVEHYDLESEVCKSEAPLAEITDDERDFLLSGHRVELNALTSPQFVEWLETKLSEHLPERMVPEDNVIGEAYRRALAVAEINVAIEPIAEKARGNAADAKVPQTLRDELAEAMEDDPHLPWDQALYEIAKAKVEGEK